MMKLFAMLLLTIAAVGCASSSIDERKKKLHAGLDDREVLAVESVLHWYRHYRNPKFAYHFDERDGPFSAEVKKRIAAEIPEFSDTRDKAFFYVSISKIEFPGTPFGYAEVIIGDPFYAERYVEVFERKARGWEIIDSITIGTGTLEAITTEFNWPAYYRDLKKQRPNQSPEPTAVLVTPRAEPRVAPSTAVAHL
jgi:hypothetical protein